LQYEKNKRLLNVVHPTAKSKLGCANTLTEASPLCSLLWTSVSVLRFGVTFTIQSNIYNSDFTFSKVPHT